MSQPQLDKLVAYMAQALVDKPSAVEVSEFDTEGGVLYELRVDSDDIGKVIGKAGRTAEAMRVILNAASFKQGRRVHLDILD